MTSNKSQNQAAINKFRAELKAMVGDISNIDVRCLTSAVNAGLRVAVQETPVGDYSKVVDFYTKDGKKVNFTVKTVKMGGFMRKNWKVSPTRKTKRNAEKELFNTADYASYVNDGHRIVNRHGETVGWVEGKFMLDKAIRAVDKQLLIEFKKEVERVNRKHAK